jgi:hypothetical protein
VQLFDSDACDATIQLYSTSATSPGLRPPFVLCSFRCPDMSVGAFVPVGIVACLAQGFSSAVISGSLAVSTSADPLCTGQIEVLTLVAQCVCADVVQVLSLVATADQTVFGTAACVSPASGSLTEVAMRAPVHVGARPAVAALELGNVSMCDAWLPLHREGGCQC